jgi:hypothetical protein
VNNLTNRWLIYGLHVASRDSGHPELVDSPLKVGNHNCRHLTHPTRGKI